MRPLNLDLGQSASLWSRAEDFWHVVGWAFNCSVLHPGRWEVWRLWLDFMCDVLDDDWSERLKLADEEDGSKDRPLKDSLIFKYIDGGSIAFGRNRRILRAIFADGSHASVGEFGQIFSRELDSTAPNTETESRTASASAAVDISQNQFGDYLSDDGDEDEDQEPDVDEPPRARKRPRRGTKSNPTSTSTSTTTTASSLHLHLGGPNSLSLRQRLLSLLSCVSNRLPNSFLPLDDLYHLFIENIRHLPFPTFHRFVSPSLSLLTEPQQTTLCDYILFRMLEASAPGTDSLDSDDPCNMTQEKLEECFLSFAANTAAVADNAKVSVTLEALVVLLARDGLIVVTEGLREAVTRGIVARVEKAGAAGGDEKRKVAGRGRGRGMGMGELEQCWLLESADRLMFLVDEVLPRNERT